MSNPQYGPLFPGEQLPSPELIGFTDLGPGNRGSISAAEISSEERQQLIDDIARPDYHLPPTNRVHCVDGRGRISQGELRTLPGHADAQTAGGIVITETASRMLLVKHQTTPVSVQTKDNTINAQEAGLIPVVHGDSHKGEEGCTANVRMREATGIMANYHDLIVERVWPLAYLLELNQYTSRHDVTKLITNGERNADDDDLWDVTPAESVEIAVENGAEYETLAGDHTERLVVADTSETAFFKSAYNLDHVRADETSDKVFLASLGVLTRFNFNIALRQGKRPRDAALGSLAMILFNIAVPKLLSAEDQGNGEALPVVILGQGKKS